MKAFVETRAFCGYLEEYWENWKSYVLIRTGVMRNHKGIVPLGSSVQQRISTDQINPLQLAKCVW